MGERGQTEGTCAGCECREGVRQKEHVLDVNVGKGVRQKEHVLNVNVGEKGLDRRNMC